MVATTPGMSKITTYFGCCGLYKCNYFLIFTYDYPVSYNLKLLKIDHIGLSRIILIYLKLCTIAIVILCIWL